MLCFFYIRDAFFLLFFTVEISVLGISEVANETLYAALNECVTIEWKIEDQANLTKKIWTWTKTSVTLVEMDKKGEITPSFVKHFKDRLQMNKNGSLTICGLLYTDSGIYQQRMTFSDKDEQIYLLDLIILEKITNVKISLDSNITLNDRCNLTLSCTAEDGFNVSYSWTVPNNNPSSYSGANLHVILSVTNEMTFITCKASNPVSSKIYNFSTGEVCGVPNTGNSTKLHLLWIIVLLIICLVAVLVVIIRKSKARHSGRNKTNGEANYSEPTTVYATVTKCPPKKANDIPETQEEDEGAGPSVTLYEEVRGQKSHNHYQENRHPHDSSKGCQGTVYDMVRHVETQSRDETE